MASDRHLARALSFSVCMKYDTESEEEEEEQQFGLEQPLEPPKRLHNRNSSIMGDFAAIEQQLALQQPANDAAAMPPPAARKPAKKQPANEGAIQVCLRVRGPCEREQDDENCITELTGRSVTFEPTIKNLQSANQVTSETYFFDRVFAPGATQQEVYEGSVESIVRGVVAGRSGLVFAFGITNAGKTFTIQGSTEQPGILPRALGQLFAMTKSDTTAKVALSFMEIYNENVYDLLGAREADATSDSLTRAGRTGPLGPSLQLQDLKNGVVVKGLTQRSIETVEQAANHLAEGIEFRQVAHTDSNHESSRSHSLVTITLQRGDGTKTNLVVVDLAGSERAKKTNADLKLKESARINTSLMNLGRCLEVLRANQKLVGSKRKFRQVVPFRQAKITRVLREPLTGGGNVVMLCSIYGGSSDADETVHALRYASTAREVATLGAVSEKFMPAVATNPKKRSLVPRCADVGSKTRTVDRNDPQTSTMPTVGEVSDESFASSCAPGTVENKGNLSAQLCEAHATIAQLRLQIENHDQVTANLEDEIREEMAEEMESVMNQMEETYQSKLEREIAIHEERFQHKLGILDHFGPDEPQRSPARVARERLELEQLRNDKAELQQALDAQVAAVKSECARELEDVRIQHAANVQMEVETIEHQLSEVNAENDRLKKELNAVRKQLQHVTKVSQSLIEARAEVKASAAAPAGQVQLASKKEKASRKRRKKNEAATVNKHKADEGAAELLAKPPVSQDTSEQNETATENKHEADEGAAELLAKSPVFQDTPEQNETATVNQHEADEGATELPPSETQTEASARSEVQMQNSEDAKAATTGQGIMVEAEVVEILNEAVQKVALQAKSQDHQATEENKGVSLEISTTQPDRAEHPAGSVSHREHAKVERNYVGNESMLEKLRESDFESKVQHDCNELRAEVRQDYNEAHMADKASHTHLSTEHNHSEIKHAEVTQPPEETCGLSVTDQLKNRLNRLKKAAATTSSSRSGASSCPSNQTSDTEPVAVSSQQSEPASENAQSLSKENQPPTPARSSCKRRTTDEVEEEVERFEALEQAASDDLGANRRLTRSAMRQRVL